MTQFERSNEIARYAYDAMKSKTEEEIKLLDVSNITTIADMFLIVTAPNTRAVSGLAQEVERKLEEKGYEKISVEGYNTSRWILLDYNGVIIHIFHKEEAEFYNLDKLWSDGKIIELE